MPNTRGTTTGRKQVRTTDDTLSSPLPGTSPARLKAPDTAASSPHPNPRHADDIEVAEMLASLTEENKTLVKILKRVIAKDFKTELETLKDEIIKKDTLISTLTDEVSELKTKLYDLESHIDRVEQYERRDTLIVSGPALPVETQAENPTMVAVSTMKDQLKINLKVEDISVAHRLGPVSEQRNRPIIVKLVNRSLKYDLVGACVRIKPNLYLNESLTPKRLAIFKQVLAIRKEHRPKFQQLFTKDGNIIVKLKHSTVKHTITNHTSLMAWLDMYPYMKETYEKFFSAD